MSSVADLVDRALEIGVVPSFTRVGADVRSRLDHWMPVDAYDLTGRVVVVTGATSGLGLAAASRLATCGATLELVARNREKASEVCSRMRDAGAPGGVDFVIADVSDLGAVRLAAEAIGHRHEHVDALVHNAGALDNWFAKSPQGIERTVAGQVVGPFLLTELLLPRLRAAAPGSRVVWVSSGGMYSQPLSVAALESSAIDYDGTKAYARAKRAQVTLAEMWAERLRADGIVVHSMHPGWADTPGVRESLPAFRRVMGPLLRTPEQGADTIVWLVADDGAPIASTGEFWLDRRPRAIHRLPSTRRSDTPAERRRLWEWCVEHSSRGECARA